MNTSLLNALQVTTNLSVRIPQELTTLYSIRGMHVLVDRYNYCSILVEFCVVCTVSQCGPKAGLQAW